MVKQLFEPTAEQRGQVKAMVAYGIPLEKIAPLITDPETDRPIGGATLRRVFRHEIEIGEVEATAQVSQSLYHQAVGRPAQYDARGNLIRAEIKPDTQAMTLWLKLQARRRSAA